MNSHTSRLFVAALIALSAAGCTNKGSVIGSVSLERDSRPIKDARVVLMPAGSEKQFSTTTDWGGNYAIHVKEGGYTVAAEHPGMVICEPGPQPVQVVGNKVATVDLCLQEESAAAGSLAPPTGPAGASLPADAAPQEQTLDHEQNNQLEVRPLPDADSNATTDAATGTAPSQYPPSAPPAYPPASSAPAATD